MTARVPGIGSTRSSIAIVGEAPGEYEERLRQPFIGPAGQLLTKLLQQVGIMRKDCYITNVIKERPLHNDVAPFIKIKSDRVVSQSPAFLAYKKELIEEIKGTEANVVVAAGNIALWALCDLLSISKRRGSILWSEAVGKKVIPIIHPSAALRIYDYQSLIRMDLKRVLEESCDPVRRLPERNLIVEPDFSSTIDFIKEAAHCPYIGFDIEVVRDHVSCLAIATNPYEAMCIPFSYHKGDYFTPDQEAKVWACLQQLLENPNVIKVGHNITFDATYMLMKLGIVIAPVEDSMVAQGILLPEQKKGLDFVTSVYTKEPYYKDEGKRWMSIGGSDVTFWQYNAKDACLCLEVLPKLKSELTKYGNLPTYQKQLSLIPPLVYMHWKGMRIDVDKIREAVEQSALDLITLEDQLTEVVGHEINPKSSAQVKSYFYDELKLKPYINRKTHNPTTEYKALVRLAARGYEAASILIQIRKINKFRDSYLKMKLDPDNRIRCSFNPVGTKSGRLSSSKTILGTGGNMQNLPPEFKKFCLCDDGYVLYNVDLSQAENRVVAYIAPETNMIHAFESGIDIHKQTASLIFRKPIESITPEERKVGKVSNHGLNYGMSYRKFAHIHELEESFAKFVHTRYHEGYPGVRTWHESIQYALSNGRALYNPFGRKRIFLGRWDDDLFKEAYSFIPQSTVADIINQLGLRPLFEDPFFKDVELLNQVHDSLVFQIPLSVPWIKQGEIALRLRQSLEQPIVYKGVSFRIPADFSIGRNLKELVEVKFRTAEQAADALGQAWYSEAYLEQEEEIPEEEDENDDPELIAEETGF